VIGMPRCRCPQDRNKTQNRRIISAAKFMLLIEDGPSPPIKMEPGNLLPVNPASARDREKSLTDIR